MILTRAPFQEHVCWALYEEPLVILSLSPAGRWVPRSHHFTDKERET